MENPASGDQLALIRIDGMHCHRCEHNIQRALTRNPGVHEVEVDYPSGQASVLYDPLLVAVPQLLQSVASAGYKVEGVSQLATPAATR